MEYRIPFNRPSAVGREREYVLEAIDSGRLSGDGPFGKRCEALLEERCAAHRALVTASCSGALDLAAVLCDLDGEAEVILPSYTFTSTANSVARTGARPVFVDIREDTLNLDERLVEAALTDRTRAIWPIHYAGVSCEMDPILELARDRGLRVVEDAAQGVGSLYRGRPLGTIGDLGTFSFHETKNVVSGEGGALIVNAPDLTTRAEVLREKGTNRAQFFRGEVDKYTWVDVGYSELASELVSAFLLAQLEEVDRITARRRHLWDRYHAAFADADEKGAARRPIVPDHCEHNAHIYYLLLPDEAARNAMMDAFRQKGILAVFHYLPLHLAPVGRRYGYREGSLPVTEDLSGRLLRLPLFFGLTDAEQDDVIAAALGFLG